MTRPDILWIMSDVERFPPGHEPESIAKWQPQKLPGRQRLLDGGMSFQRHYTGSSACVPSRTTVFTGQLPSRLGNADPPNS